MKKFEYKVFSKLFNVEQKLNELGEEGWELASVWDGAFYMKREKN